jgi:DNA segregation ATPase FtsK/SpoIIIE, S-DNA-T family
VIREGRGSVSLLQRSLGIGYGRAARLIDFMAEDGFVGPYNGSQAREVLLTVEDWERRNGQSSDGASAPAPTSSARNNKILLDRPEDVHPPLPALAVPKHVPIISSEAEDETDGLADEEDETDYEEDEFDEEEGDGFDDDEEYEDLEEDEAEEGEYDEAEDEEQDDQEVDQYDEEDDEASEEDEESSALTSGDKKQIASVAT